MKESIQLSELQNYLAYGLKLHQWGCGLNLITVMNANNMMNIIDHETNYKPLVKPLSELAEFLPLLTERSRNDFNTRGINAAFGWWAYKDITILFEHHFDVFGWLERGLALSLTDFEKEKAL